MAGCFLCIKQALVGGFCSGCGTNIFMLGVFIFWFALKGLALYLYGDEDVEPGEVLVRAAEAGRQWALGLDVGGKCAVKCPVSHKGECCGSSDCDEGKGLKLSEGIRTPDRAPRVALGAQTRASK